jgi:hypothetical protein
VVDSFIVDKTENRNSWLCSVLTFILYLYFKGLAAKKVLPAHYPTYLHNTMHAMVVENPGVLDTTKA